MNDTDFGEAAGRMSSVAAETRDIAEGGRTATNGQQADNAESMGVRSSGGGLGRTAQKPAEDMYAREATGAPIGQISYGHDGGSPSNSRSTSLDETYDADTRVGEVTPTVDTAPFTGDSCASILAYNITSSDNKISDGPHLESNERERNDSVEEQMVSGHGQETPFSPASLKRSYSMPEKTSKGDHSPERVGGGGDAMPPTRLPSASMANSGTKVGAPPGEKAYEQQLKHQQQIQQPISLSSEDDEISTTLPQTLEQSTIVEKSPAERYIRFNEKLGSGAYKDVYRAYDTIEGIEVAWNVVKLHGVPKAERVRIVNEVRLLERLHHPNIISFHGSWVNRETERVIFVTEILSSGTLKSFVQKVQLIRWKIFKRWAIQILKGLEYLHSQDPPIIHRDLKCDNIFINGTSGDLRIGDFGLSTAISKKNQPLSVLGTPEFMAPELYDENYDEKVDIYAFGMLLLEIITNQVPYHECANPAQIYKKVISGIPPASLRRVKSENARNFILLCLGIGKDASLRPSATELLNNPFLAKHVNDDGTIEVEPAIEEMIIDEMAPLESRPGSLRDAKGASLTISETASERSAEKFSDQYNAKYSQSIDGYELPSKGVSFVPPAEQDEVRDESTVSSKPSESANGDDHFGEMPENEANMKRVKVLMGRGTELDDDEEPPSQQLEETSLSNPPPGPQIPHVLAPVPAPLQATKTAMTRTISELDASSLGSAPQYKVSAVPHPEIPPLNDAINLALTLPDENQTTVEFVFDLVNDDPVQVAKEMVMELDEVPNDAVLDISEAISGVARHVRQQNFLAQKQQQHGMLMHPQGGMMQSQGIPPQPQQPGLGGQQQVIYGSGYTGIGYQTPGAPMIQSHLGTGSEMSSTLQQPHQQTPHLIFQTPGGANIGEGNDGNPSLQQQPLPPTHVAFQSSTGHPVVQQHLGDQKHNISFHTPGGTPNIQQHVMTKQQQQQVLGYQAPPGSIGQQQQHSEAHSHVRVPHHLRMGSDLSTQQTRQLSPVPQPAQMAVQRTQQLPSRPSSVPQLTQSTLSQQNVVALRSLDTSISIDELITTQAPQLMQPTMNNQETLSLYEVPTVQSHDAGVQNTLIPHPQHKEAVVHGCQPPHMGVVPETSELEDVPEDGGVDAEEMRKLEEEFEKRLQRAKKSFGTRMDNLHRSKVEAEAQHQMTLEKHEKERIEFEKRVRLAEEEQNRRLNQIEKEFLEKKNQFRQQRAGQSISEKPPLHGGHKRSSSHFDPSLQRPTPAADLRRNTSMQQPMANDHRRNHSTQSSISCSTSDISEDHQVDPSPNAPSSVGLFIDEIKHQPLSNQQHVRQVESSQSLTIRDRSDSTSSPA